MDGRLIALVVALAVIWLVGRWWSERSARTVYVAPVFRMTVTAERARELAEQRTRLALDAEAAALSRGEQSDILYSSRVRALSRLVAEIPAAPDYGEPFERG